MNAYTPQQFSLSRVLGVQGGFAERVLISQREGVCTLADPQCDGLHLMHVTEEEGCVTIRDVLQVCDDF